MSITKKLTVGLITIAVVLAAVIGVYTWNSLHNKAMADADEQAMNLISRSAQMFVVSTTEFNKAYDAAEYDEERQDILDDWNRTIRAVDEAVIHNFGDDQARARLIGDAGITGIEPFGGDSIKIEIPFEKEALEAQMKGEKMVRKIDGDFLRVSIPLTSNIHKGCAQCHSQSTNPNDAIVMGSLNAYIPLKKSLASAKTEAAITTAVLVGFLAPIILAIGIFITRVVIRPIRGIVNVLKDIAEGEGDLTRRVPVSRNDEIGQLSTWFNTFIDKLHAIISDVASSATEVAGASTEIAASSEEMAAGLNEQNRQVNQVAAAVEQMSASVVDVAQQSMQAADNARNSGEIATEGGSAVNRTIEGMHSIKDAVNSSADSVITLGKRGEQIGQIIQVINDIADQTNLLALNAAIEAARAGEAGRGFAVVADEVRKLADRTTTATQEISESIEAIQHETKQAVERITSGNDQVTEGVELATGAGESLEQIVSSANQVSSMIASIAAAAEEQSAASEQVKNSIDTITAVSQQANEGASQTSTAAVQLSTKAEQLQSIVQQFKLNND